MLTSTQAPPTDHSGPYSASGFVEARLCGHVGEGSIAVVVIQRIAMHSADENIFVPVVVVVANGDAGVVAMPARPALAVTSVKCPFAVILEKPVRVFRRSSS